MNEKIKFITIITVHGFARKSSLIDIDYRIFHQKVQIVIIIFFYYYRLIKIRSSTDIVK